MTHDNRTKRYQAKNRICQTVPHLGAEIGLKAPRVDQGAFC